MLAQPTGQPPISLHASLSSAELAELPAFDRVFALGSYWVRRQDQDLQSCIIRYLKDAGLNQPNPQYIRSFTHSYASMLIDECCGWRPDAIVRVLGSAETTINPLRPLSDLSRIISTHFRVPDYSYMFFRSEPRKPMRMVDQLCGSDMLKRRIQYMTQDLFIRPNNVQGSVLLIDDIYNLGATARVYSATLKKYCNVEKVVTGNLAAARFLGGRDGWGQLKLDIDRFLSVANQHVSPSDSKDGLEIVWVSKTSAEFHSVAECPKMEGKGRRSLRFLACREHIPCPICIEKLANRSIWSWLKK